MAKGSGQGGVSEGNVVAGSALAAGLAICFCVIGAPVILVAIILVAVASPQSSAFIAGVVLLVIAGLCLVAGLVAIVLLCTGVCEKKSRTVPQTVYPQPVVYHSNVVMHQGYASSYGTAPHGVTTYGTAPQGMAAYSSHPPAPPSYQEPAQSSAPAAYPPSQPSTGYLPNPPPYKEY